MSSYYQPYPPDYIGDSFDIKAAPILSLQWKRAICAKIVAYRKPPFVYDFADLGIFCSLELSSFWVDKIIKVKF